MIESVALERKIPLKSGVLWTTTGPMYETAAEIRMIERLGGDAGSMSTSPEVITANQLKLPVIGISCITNYATGITEHRLSHDDVTQTAIRVRELFLSLLTGIVTKVFDTL
jgi:purine-nucleoside phosphorylase